MAYTNGEVVTNTVIIITATSQYAGKRMTNVTLLPHNTINFGAHFPSLTYTNEMLIPVTCTSGDPISLSASGEEKNTK